MDVLLAYRILRVRLVPVSDLGTHKPMNTTAGRVEWSGEFIDQLCSLGFGSEKKGPLCYANSKTFRSNPWSHYLCQVRTFQCDRHFNAVCAIRGCIPVEVEKRVIRTNILKIFAFVLLFVYS